MPELLLEIGVEELPASWLEPLTMQLGEALTATAGGEGLGPRDVRTFATPRRLVLAAEVLARQPDREDEAFGPALRVARDGAGAWSKAALGFARKSGVEPDALGQAPRDPAKPDELYLVFRRRIEGRAAPEVLPAVLAATLRRLAFPKRMSWDACLDDGRGALPFGRPIRWLVCLLGGEVVPFRIHALEHGRLGEVLVTSADQSRGHRFLPRAGAGRPFPVRSLADLRDKLARASVVLDSAEREASIRAALAPHLPAGADDHGLIAEWRDLVERPAVLFGRVPDAFQALPREVLETVLVHHQKYLPLVSDGQVRGFAAIANTDPDAGGAIVAGMERVVVARLRDAAFFFAEDGKRPLGDRVEDLAGVTFHRALGSYRDKVERVVALIEHMGSDGLLAGDALAAARDAARLSKADLTTLMVGEFPELQGVMGGLYLEAEGAPAAVAAAVRWHYHPVSLEVGDAPAGRLPSGAEPVFAAVSLADKLDTLAAYFALGEVPTGSRDPYGLRRAGQGAVRVALDFAGAGPPPDLGRLSTLALERVREGFDRAPSGTEAALRRFLVERLEFVLSARGHARDEVAAVLAAPGRDPLADARDCLERVTALGRVRTEAAEDFEHLAVAFKRANNILKDATPAAVAPALFAEPAETELHAAVERLSGEDGSYEERLRALRALRAPVDRFFDDVLVMAEDPAVRANRLGLLDRARALIYRIADISRLGG